jgi:hypothetical protein
MGNTRGIALSADLVVFFTLCVGLIVLFSPLRPLSTSPKRMPLFNCCVYKYCEQNSEMSGGRNREVCWCGEEGQLDVSVEGFDSWNYFCCLRMNFKTWILGPLHMLHTVISEIYRMLKKSLCTWRLQYTWLLGTIGLLGSRPTGPGGHETHYRHLLSPMLTTLSC